MTVTVHPPYITEAFGATAYSVAYDYALLSCLEICTWNRLKGLVKLVDPSHAGAQAGGEPGWSIERQMVPGEARHRVARLRIECQNYLPRPPIFVEPAEDAGPDKTWPDFARFKVELVFPDEFGNPEYPLRYYDATTFEGFLRKILAVYVKHHPEEAGLVQQILEHAHYWVDHDRKPA
jgi:hypothetical protein